MKFAEKLKKAMQELNLNQRQVVTLTGVVTDPTTAGITDSTQALEYTEPKK